MNISSSKTLICSKKLFLRIKFNFKHIKNNSYCNLVIYSNKCKCNSVLFNGHFSLQSLDLFKKNLQVFFPHKARLVFKVFNLFVK